MRYLSQMRPRHQTLALEQVVNEVVMISAMAMQLNGRSLQFHHAAASTFIPRRLSSMVRPEPALPRTLSFADTMKTNNPYCAELVQDRRQARQRREFLYKKSLEAQAAASLVRKEKTKAALGAGQSLTNKDKGKGKAKGKVAEGERLGCPDNG